METSLPFSVHYRSDSVPGGFHRKVRQEFEGKAGRKTDSEA